MSNRNPTRNTPNRNAGIGGSASAQLSVSTSPLPDPGIFNRYEPHVQDTIMEMTKKEQEHRHAMNAIVIEMHKESLRREIGVRKIGQFLAIGAVIVVCLFAGYLAHLGYSNYAAMVAGGVLVSLVIAFLTSGKTVKLTQVQPDISGLNSEIESPVQ